MSELLKAQYPEFLLDLTNPRVMLDRLKSRVMNNRPYARHCNTLIGPKFEREVSKILSAQAGTHELKTFRYRKQSGTVSEVDRLDIVWLTQGFEFAYTAKQVATHLECSERQVKSMISQIRGAGIKFTKRAASDSDSWAPENWQSLRRRLPDTKPDLRPQRFRGWTKKGLEEWNIFYRQNPEKAKEFVRLIDRQNYRDWTYGEKTARHEPDWIPSPESSMDILSPPADSSCPLTADGCRKARTSSDQQAYDGGDLAMYGGSSHGVPNCFERDETIQIPQNDAFDFTKLKQKHKKRRETK